MSEDTGNLDSFEATIPRIGHPLQSRRRARKPMLDKQTFRVWIGGREVHPLNYKVSRRGDFKFVRQIRPGPVSFEWLYSGAIGRTRYRNWTTRDAQRVARRCRRK